MNIKDSFNILGNIPELCVDPIVDSLYEGHVKVKVDPTLFEALWYYADVAHNSKNRIWTKWLEILDVFYNQEDSVTAKRLIKSLETKTGADKQLKAGLMTLKYIIDKTPDFEKEYTYKVSIPEELR